LLFFSKAMAFEKKFRYLVLTAVPFMTNIGHLKYILVLFE